MKTIENTQYFTIKELEQTHKFDSQIIYKLRILDEEMCLIGEQRFMPKSYSFNHVIHYSKQQIPELRKILKEMTTEKRAKYKRQINDHYEAIRKANNEAENNKKTIKLRRIMKK